MRRDGGRVRGRRLDTLDPGPDALEGLGAATIRRGTVTVVGQTVRAVLQLLGLVVLARLLRPADFGLFAMAGVVTAFVALFRDAGLTQAVVQRERLDHAQASVILWVNVAVTAALALLVIVVSPFVAALYGEPRLVFVVVALGAALFVGGLGAQHQALMARRMQFRTLATLEVVSHALGLGVAIVLALLGAGVWALVALPCTQAGTLTVMSWYALPWRPDAPRRAAGVGGLLSFGADVTGFNVANFAARNADDLLIGIAHGAVSLGLYSRAYELLVLPLRQLNAPLARVALPTLSRLIDDPARYRSGYIRMVGLSTTLIAPPMAVASVMAGDVLLVTLGAQWTAAAPMLTWLALAGVVQPLSNTTGWLFQSQGRTRELLLWGVGSSVVTVGVFVVVLPAGAVGVAQAYAVLNLVLLPFLLWWVGRTGAVSTADLYRILGLPVTLAAVMGGAAWVSRSILVPGLSAPPRLAVSVAVSSACGLAVVLASRRGRELVADAKFAVRHIRGTDELTREFSS